MTAAWVTIAALCAGTVAIKSLGPVALGGRRPSERIAGVIGLVAPSLLAALVVYEAFGSHGPGLAFDARLVGLGVAGLALAARAPLLVIVALAAVTTALARAVL
jgi:Branched-chain amino acid transport protein (AzlD)